MILVTLFSFFLSFLFFFLFLLLLICEFGLVIWVCRNIMPYVKKYGKHPVTGAPLKVEDLIPLTFHKNSDGE